MFQISLSILVTIKNKTKKYTEIFILADDDLQK